MCKQGLCDQCWCPFIYIKSTTIAVGRPDNKQNHCGTREECECEELRFRRGSPLVCEVM